MVAAHEIALLMYRTLRDARVLPASRADDSEVFDLLMGPRARRLRAALPGDHPAMAHLLATATPRPVGENVALRLAGT